MGFAIGEVAFIMTGNTDVDVRWWGREVTILSAVFKPDWAVKYLRQYTVDPSWAPGQRWTVAEAILRKRPPAPGDDAADPRRVVRWDACPWQPDRVKLDIHHAVDRWLKGYVQTKEKTNESR